MKDIYLRREEISTLKAVAESSGGLNVYSIAMRTKIGPVALARACDSLDRRGLVQVLEARVSLTQAGRETVLALGPDLLHSEKKPWREVPAETKVTPLPPFRPFLPQFTNVDPSILPPGFAKLVKAGRREGVTRASTLE